MKKGIWVTIIVAIVLIVGAIFILNGNGSTNTNNENSGAQTGTIAQGATGSEPETQQILENQNQTSGKTYNVTIKGFEFNPQNLTINAGDTVTWTNEDSAGHTITSDSGGELISNRIYNGQSFTHTFTTAGTYDYHCSIHTSMHGSVTVQ